MVKLGVGLPLQLGNVDDLQVVVGIFKNKTKEENVSLKSIFCKAVLKEKYLSNGKMSHSII